MGRRILEEIWETETPFRYTERAFSRMQLLGKTQSNGVRNFSYRLIVEKYREFRTEGRIESALQCCKMKRVMKRLLEQGEGGKADDVSTIADICEIALDNGEFKIAKE